MKRILFVFASFLVLMFPITAFARTYYYTAPAIPVATATPTPTPAPVDSFQLFWPMSAGKTMQSKVYFLKIWKEKIRGFFIFGSAQKADYDIFLGIKRMLEAEVLMKGNVTDLSDKTLDSAASEFDKASTNLTNAKNSGDVDQNTKNEINTRVSNLKKFVTYLINQYPSYKTKLQSILDKLNNITI